MNVYLVFLDLPFGLCWAASCVAKAIIMMGTMGWVWDVDVAGKELAYYVVGHLKILCNRIGFTLKSIFHIW